jgi:hypothetical protein
VRPLKPSENIHCVAFPKQILHSTCNLYILIETIDGREYDSDPYETS